MKNGFMSSKIKSIGLICFYITMFLIIVFFAYYFYTDFYTVYLMEKDITIDIGNQYQIELLPKNSKYFDYENYVYKVEDPSIVKVTNLGELTALKEGSTKVNVRFKNGYEKETLDVNVKNIEVTTLEVEKEFSLEKNSSKRLSVKINNKDNISTNLVFWSEDTSIATVDNYGNVTGINEGETYIVVKSNNNVEEKVRIIVKTSDVKIQKITIEQKTITLKKEKTSKLNISTVPSNASLKDLKWNSNNPEIVAVDSNGVVTAISNGTAIVSVTTPDGLNAQTIIHVEEDSKTTPDKEEQKEPTQITLNTTNSSVCIGDTLKINATITPNNATNKTITWTSSDNNIATVTNGTVKGISVGSVTITAKTSNGKTAIAKITVKNKDVDVTSIKIDGNVSSLYVGDSVILSASITPSNATNKNLKWISSDTNIAIVDSNGKVTAKKSGSVKITVTSNSNSKASDSKTIIINEKTIPVVSLTSNVESYSLGVDESYSWKVTVNPSNATNKQILYSSSDESFAVVDKNGKITVKKDSGSAIITAKSKENNNINTTIEIRSIVKYLDVSAGVHKQTYNKISYYEIIPPNATTNLPLIIFLHGDGELGKFSGVKSTPIYKYVKSKNATIDNQPFIFIAIQRPSSDYATEKNITKTKEVIDHVVEEYEIDKDRISITGFSGGAILTWGTVSHYPDFFSCAVPVSCAPQNAKAANFKTTPIWSLAGNSGPNEPTYNSRMKYFVKKINKAGGNAKHDTKSGQTHATIQSKVYNNASIYKWMLTQEKQR